METGPLTLPPPVPAGLPNNVARPPITAAHRPAAPAPVPPPSASAPWPAGPAPWLLQPAAAAVRPSSPLQRRVVQVVVLPLIGLMVLAGLVLLVLDVLVYAAARFADEFGLALLIGLAASAVPVAFLRFLDRRNPKPWWLYAVAFGWGGIVATGWSGVFNTIVDDVLLGLTSEENALAIGAPLAGPVEEPLKALGVLLLFWLLRSYVANARDGFVVGALVGLGFNWLETAGYVVQLGALLDSTPWAMQFGNRFALLGLGAHTLWTALFGMFLGLTRQPRRRWTRFAPLIGLVIVTLTHALSNGGLVLLDGDPTDPASTAAVAVPPSEGLSEFVGSWIFGAGYQLLFLPVWVLAGVMLARSGHWQRTVLRIELAGEVGGAVTRPEYEDVLRDHPLARRRIPGLSGRRSARLVAAQNALAFRRYQVRAAGGDVAYDPLVQRIRGEVARRRADAAPGVPGALPGVAVQHSGTHVVRQVHPATWQPPVPPQRGLVGPVTPPAWQAVPHRPAYPLASPAWQHAQPWIPQPRQPV